MKVHTLELGSMGNCTYIVENAKEALIIDPSWDMPQIYDFLQDINLTPKAVLFTHGHYDHCTNAAELLKRYNIKGYIEKNDLALSGLPQDLLITFEGDFKQTLAGLEVSFIHTPGHTKGSCCILAGNALFTGDTLFPGAVGRTDLPGSSSRELQNSLEKLAHGLPPSTEVYSGHAYGPQGNSFTTLGYEIKNNPFVKLALKDPHYFDDLI